MSNNTIVRGLLVPSLKNKPLDGRQDVPTLADIVNIENPYVNFIFPVAETGKWYKVLSLTDKVIDELVIPNGMIDEYEPFGEGMTDEQKEEYLTKSLAEQTYLKKEDAVEEYLNKTEAEETYQQKGDYVTTEEGDDKYQPKGDYATKKELDDLEQRISEGGGEGEGGSFIDAPKDGKTYGRKDGLWNELVDAPSDGMAYARINGKWAAIDSGNALDPMLPVLSLTINSSRDEDLTIENVIASVTYADKEFALGNGGKINVPYGLSVAVTFPNVDNYTTPNVVVFDNVQGNISAEGTYIDLRETVDVYVSADDSSSVDGQIVTVGKISRRPNGVYIEDKNGKLWTKEEWDGSVAYSSVVLIHNEHAFGIHGGDFTGILGDEKSYSIGAKSHFNLEMAKEDFDGAGNSAQIFYEYSSTNDSIAKKIKAIKFATGKSAFIPALGQLLLIEKYVSSINEMLHFVGESSVSTRYSRSSTFQRTSSSYQSTWCIASSYEIKDVDVDVYYTMFGNYSSIACCTISDEQCLYTPEPEEYEVRGGKVSFGALAGDTVSAKVNDKGEGYRTPEEVHLLVQNGENNISLVYNKLIIDTIYINNLIADTSSIISGEMNGKAVQAIWNNVHRYLGKIVDKDDGDNELVLLDIDQNDNRYYTDGSMIDLEALGTNAYFFTKIPSMAYKITQMSENIYKVQISYKHNPGGEGWKYFDELIVPTFASSDGTNDGHPVYYEKGGNRYSLNSNNLYLDAVNLFDLSNMFLLLLSRYGVDPEYKQLESFELGIFENSSIEVLNGYSLTQGVKDAKFMYSHGDSYNNNAGFPVYSLLGIENLIEGVYQGQYFSSARYASATLPIKMRDPKTHDVKESIVFTPSTDKLQITMLDGTYKDYTTTVYEDTGFYKSLLIEDYFFFIPKTLGATSESYYKSKFLQYNISQTSTGYFILGFYMGLYMHNSEYPYVARPKIVCPYRIESDREAFNELTNIWK